MATSPVPLPDGHPLKAPVFPPIREGLPVLLLGQAKSVHFRDDPGARYEGGHSNESNEMARHQLNSMENLFVLLAFQGHQSRNHPSCEAGSVLSHCFVSPDVWGNQNQNHRNGETHGI